VSPFFNFVEHTDVLNASEAIYNPIHIGKRAEIEFKMAKCGCSRNLKGIYPNPSYIKINQTTCGSDAFHRGPHQKVHNGLIFFLKEHSC
jgi:hypothetical protein